VAACEDLLGHLYAGGVQKAQVLLRLRRRIEIVLISPTV
jgi:hypothetical protein